MDDYKYIGFFNQKAKYGFLSNFYPCNFTLDDVTFSSSEQAFHYYKAVLFKDEEIMKKILLSNDPAEAKALGKKVKNFNTKIWDDNKVIICKMILKAKFGCNEDLKKKLLDTGDAFLVECSPYDRIWGIGYRNTDYEFLNRKRELWGQNLLGEVLMKVRDSIR